MFKMQHLFFCFCKGNALIQHLQHSQPYCSCKQVGGLSRHTQAVKSEKHYCFA